MNDSRFAGLRCADLIVALCKVVWTLSVFALGVVGHPNDTSSAPLSSLVFGLVLTFGTNLPFLIGIAKGRRWGFVGMAILASLVVAGAIIRPPSAPWATLGQITIGLDTLVLAYCLFRLRQERSDVRSLPRTSLQKINDALFGTLGASWVLALAVFIGPELLRQSYRPLEVTALRGSGVMGLGYLVACAGVGFGRRWGFISMVVANLFLLFVEVSGHRYRPLVSQEIVIVAFCVVAIVYCALRLRTGPPRRAVETP